jgi:class 3 adenylate cyclase
MNQKKPPKTPGLTPSVKPEESNDVAFVIDPAGRSADFLNYFGTGVQFGSTGLVLPGAGKGLGGLGAFAFDTIESHPKYLGLVEETRTLRAKLLDKNNTAEEQKRQIDRLTKLQDLGFLLSRVNENARTRLLDSDEFAANFLERRVHDSFVMSVDIRRSTELMLKARTPELFAAFITALCRELTQVVTQNWGVLDKFTGDGILTFYPAFYSGPDAGLLAIAAAEQCHRVFTEQYRQHRHCFSSVLMDVGLGIGIDFGQTHLLRIADGLTVVGEPVVYACRMGGAPPGVTLLNQRAYEVIRDRYAAHCVFRETKLTFKHEGDTLAYAVSLKGSELHPSAPDWLQSGAEMAETKPAVTKPA